MSGPVTGLLLIAQRVRAAHLYVVRTCSLVSGSMTCRESTQIPFCAAKGQVISFAFSFVFIVSRPMLNGLLSHFKQLSWPVHAFSLKRACSQKDPPGSPVAINYRFEGVEPSPTQLHGLHIHTGSDICTSPLFEECCLQTDTHSTGTMWFCSL